MVMIFRVDELNMVNKHFFFEFLFSSGLTHVTWATHPVTINRTTPPDGGGIITLMICREEKLVAKAKF